MKCPKCSYISFDTPERCRNCGYDYSLAPRGTSPVDLPIRRFEDPLGPPPDLAIGPGEGAGSAREAADPGSRPAPPSEPQPPAPLELPLFQEAVPGVDDTPLITAFLKPRQPLSVRRASSDASRLPPITVTATTESAAPARKDDAPLMEFPSEQRHAGGQALADAAGGEVVGRRLLAGIIDLAIIGAIDVAVIHFTLKLTGLDWSQVLQVPFLPLLGFFAILNGGYLAAFTVASGQTVGKMLAGVRVETDGGGRVPLATAVVRVAAYGISVLPAGVGLLPIFFAPDGRALHDRLSNTHVTRA